MKKIKIKYDNISIYPTVVSVSTINLRIDYLQKNQVVASKEMALVNGDHINLWDLKGLIKGRLRSS